jgi:hypothetical protein
LALWVNFGDKIISLDTKTVIMTSFRKVRKINERREKKRPYLMFVEEMINSSSLLTLHDFWEFKRGDGSLMEE